MEVISARNVNGAWDQARAVLNGNHVVRPSRVGEVWEYPTPVVTEYLEPIERVLFNPERNGNPIFHFMEGLWMLAGRNDIGWLVQFNPRMKEFSDDGIIQHGAYGHRWRFAFDLDGGAEDDYADQLRKAIRMLKKNPDERRVVVAMWNPLWDLERPDVKDVPCNTHIYFKIRECGLTMTVNCRSNDIVWGAYGANVVHMSMLHEYMASMIGVPVGTYWQISDSWHAYTERWEQFGGKSLIPTTDCYAEGLVAPYPMVVGGETEHWDSDLRHWMDGFAHHSNRNPFFAYVATPLWHAWHAYKENKINLAIRHAQECRAEDWSWATVAWLRRIQAKREQKAAGA